MEFSRLLEVARETGPQILGLAHVEDDTVGIEELVHAWGVRQQANLFADVEGGGHGSKIGLGLRP
jgi:hypothetical protein